MALYVLTYQCIKAKNNVKNDQYLRISRRLSENSYFYLKCQLSFEHLCIYYIYLAKIKKTSLFPVINEQSPLRIVVILSQNTHALWNSDLTFVTGPFSSNVGSKLKNSPDRIVNCPSICNVSFFHHLCLDSNKSRHRHIPPVATLNILANDTGKKYRQTFWWHYTHNLKNLLL